MFTPPAILHRKSFPLDGAVVEQRDHGELQPAAELAHDPASQVAIELGRVRQRRAGWGPHEEGWTSANATVLWIVK
jgi:hypothetical protein